MSTRIDYIAVFAPLEIICDNEKISAEERLKMVMAAIKEVLKEARNEK